MWIGDVELPRDLVDAHRAGELVIFVGAGASVAAPAGLPDFWRLAQEIAADAGVTIEAGEQPDVVLGKADAHEQMDVHLRIVRKIDDPLSRPNDLHRAIGRLAGAASATRVVTTNYDRHLTTVLPNLPEYHAPALPPGDDFDGLVYLHGTLGQEPRRLVATDADFGAAYLLDGWAVRFLERMFRRFTVLFVGYSHSDFAMTYLARALPPSTRRFALTEDASPQDWRRLRITAVTYPNPAGDHAQLPVLLEKWAEQAAMSLLDHRQRIARLVAAPPSGIPEEMSYIEEAVGSTEKVKFFIEYARGSHWLDWAAERPQFRRLFAADSVYTPLADWFAQHYVAEEDLTEKAFHTVETCGGRLGPHVWSAIGQRLHHVGSPRPPWLSRWLVLLVRDDPAAGDDWLEYALAASRLPADRDAALLLFTHLTTPQVGFRRPRIGTAFELTVRGDLYWLGEAWRENFVPHLAEVAGEVLAIADTQLRQAYRQLAAVHQGKAWDRPSYERSAIEAHQQDNFPRQLHVLIDAARDCWEALFRTSPGAAVEQLRAWETAEPALLRRLAVHGWVHRGDASATAKLEWLRERGWLLDGELWHEVAVLIEQTAATADRPVLDGLVADVVTASDESLPWYTRANILAWVARHAPELASARSALAAYPDFREGRHPNLRHWSEAGTVPDRPPMSVEDLHARLQQDPAAVVAELRRFESIDWSFDETSWDDVVRLVKETVARHPDDGFLLLNEGGAALTAVVIRGWSAADLDLATAQRVVRRLDGPPFAAAAREIAGLLSGFGRSPQEAAVWRDVPGGRDLADRTWVALQSEPSNELAREPDQDWFSFAINHPGGWLAEYWVRAVEAEWQGDTDAWTGLSREMTSRFSALIDGTGPQPVAAQIMLSHHLHFLHAADRTWAESEILPLLNWSDEQRARRCWDGFLYSGRCNDRLLDAGLRDSLLGAARRQDRFGADRRRLITEFLAQIGVYAAADPADWLADFTKTATSETRTAWIRAVDDLLGQAGAETTEQQWTRWMRSYWTDRLDSKPRSLTEDEASALAGWAVGLDGSTAEAVALAVRHQARLTPHGHLLRRLGDRAGAHPEAYANLLLHLLRQTQRPFHDGYLLAPIVTELGLTINVEAIRNELVRLGCNDV